MPTHGQMGNNMDEEDFLAAVEADNAITPAAGPKEPAEPEPPAAEPAPEPPQGEPVADPALTVAPPVVEAKPDPGFVPITVVLDEREKRQKLEAELAQFRANQSQPKPATLPDVLEDQDAFTSALAQTFEERLYQQSLQMSERFARNQFGDEVTETAISWARAKCDTDTYFNAQVRDSGDPVGFAVREYQRDQIVQTVTPDDFAQFQAWKAAQAALQTSPATPEPINPPPPTTPPRSLASAPSAGGIMTSVVPSEEEIFDEVMSKR